MPTTRQQARRAATPGPASQPVPPATSTSTSSATSTLTPNRVKKRVIATAITDTQEKTPTAPETMSVLPDEERPSLSNDGDDIDAAGASAYTVPVVSSPAKTASWMKRNQWIVFALASGACAAFNGVFAKLTTTDLTTSLSLALARLFGLEKAEKVVEVVVRGSFFGLNLVFNGVMWTLFTTALARGNSTTQVSIMNTSCNFFITAILGFAIFSEALPPLWWLGAAMLVAGNVIIGSKDEGAKEHEGADATSADALSLATQDGLDSERVGLLNGDSDEGKSDDEDTPHLGLEEELVSHRR